MVWSLSKDDDGLESVHPLTSQGAPLPSAGERSAGVPPQRAAHGAVSPSSVFVDPRSQVPQAKPVPHRRQEVEATLVLKARKVDAMRAEVARQKSAYRRRKRRTLVLWVLAGGAALAMGWFVGILLSPAPSDRRGNVPSARSDSDAENSTHSRSAAEENAPPEAKDARPREGVAVTTSLEELPPEEDEKTDTAVPRGEATFTLEDLPAD